MSTFQLDLLRSWTITENAYHRAIREAGYRCWQDMPAGAFERHPAVADAHAAKAAAADAYFDALKEARHG
jgi:hypothetical protein